MTKKDNILILLLFLFIMTVFYKIAIFGKILFGDDLTLYFYPVRVHIMQQIRDGLFPLWTKDLFAGYPIFASCAPGVLYPLNLLFTIYPSWTFYHSIIVFHYFLGAFFMFLFARELNLNRSASLISAISFSFSFILIFYFRSPNFLFTAIWLPLILYFLEKYFKKNKYIFLYIASFVFGFQFFCGEPHLSLINFAFIICYWIFKAKRKIFGLFIFLLVGVSLSFLQTYPAYELLQHSERMKTSYEYVIENSLSLYSLLSRFFGFGYYPKEYKDLCIYIGVITFLLGFAGIVLLLKKDKFIIFLLTLSCISIFFATGEYNPAYKLLYQLPGFSFFRYPVKFIIIYIFCFSILSGFFINYILEQKSNSLLKINIYFIFIFLCAIVHAIYCFVKKDVAFLEGGFSFVIIFIFFIIFNLYLRQKLHKNKLIITIFTLMFISSFLNPSNLLEYKSYKNILLPLKNKDIDKTVFLTDKKIYSETPDVINYLKKDKGLYRIINVDGTPVMRNLGLLFGLAGYLGLSPLDPYYYREKVTKSSIVVDLLGLKYAILPEVANLREGFTLVYNKDVKIYKNKNILPRVLVVYNISVISDRKKIYSLLFHPYFDPTKYAFLEEDVNFFENLYYEEDIPYNAKIKQYSHNKVTILANLQTSGFLILSDAYYPGWRVYVNGEEDKIYRANYFLRSVYLTEGESTVEFIYDPISFKIGLVISMITLFGFFFYFVVYFRRMLPHTLHIRS